MPMGIVAVGLAAIGIGAAIGLAVMEPRGAAQASPGVTASASGISGSPATLSSPTATPSPTPVAIPVIPNLGIAEVALDTLPLRPTASESAEPVGLLGRGARVFVIGAPEEDGDQRWYRVAVSAGPYTSDACPDPATCRAIGWIGGPATGEDEWLTDVTVLCPISPMTIEEVGALPPLERLHCYGNGEITGTGSIDHGCCTPGGPIVYEPEWLAAPWSPQGAFFAGTGILFRSPPDAALDVPKRGALINFTGHFEDPAAPTCRASANPDETQPVELPPPARTVLQCRTELVITDYEVTGP